MLESLRVKTDKREPWVVPSPYAKQTGSVETEKRDALEMTRV